MQVAECWLALPCTALQWHQCNSECIFVTLEIHLTTLFCEIFCFLFFFVTGQDVTGRTDKNMDRQTFLGKYYFRYHIRQTFLRCTSLSSIHIQAGQNISQDAYTVVCVRESTKPIL